LIGAHCLAGSRWVAPRELKDLRWPQDENAIAEPWDAGSYVAVYFVEKGHHVDYFTWGSQQVKALYAEGRGFSERTHVHTILYDHVSASYRDDDPVPVDLALDASYDGLVVVWLDVLADRADLEESLHQALADSPIEIASTWRPSRGQDRPPGTPMDLGSGPGGKDRTAHLFFVRGDVREALPAVRQYTDTITDTGLARVHLVAPFFRTHVGTDKYTDDLW
jgi:hypothetical protein